MKFESICFLTVTSLCATSTNAWTSSSHLLSSYSDLHSYSNAYRSARPFTTRNRTQQTSRTRLSAHSVRLDESTHSNHVAVETRHNDSDIDLDVDVDQVLLTASTGQEQSLVASTETDWEQIGSKVLNGAILAVSFGYALYTIFNIDHGMTRGWTQSEIAMRIPLDNWSNYEAALAEKPIYTKTLINVVIYLLGDWLSQTVFQKKNVLDFDPYVLSIAPGPIYT